MPYSFKDRIVLVTGAGFGIGRATALAFAAEGAHVVLADRSDDTGTLYHIQEAGGIAEQIQCDIADRASVSSLFFSILKNHGRLDHAFNNAGIEGVSLRSHEYPDEEFDRVIGVNLKGTWNCLQQELMIMTKQGHGSIVNNSSIAGLVGFANAPAYVASKHAVLGFTKTAALDYALQGIRVNAVCPGIIKTPMIDRATGGQKQVEEQYAIAEPMGRLGKPEEIAQAVLWLCSDAASFVTGQALAVDGGWVAK